MAAKLRHGFKADAERLAVAVRAEHGLAATDPIDCLKICANLAIPVLTVPDLFASGASLPSIKRILAARSKFSAMTVSDGTRRLIAYNPIHARGRRANSLAHELSHILLEHPMAPALGQGGCRLWNPTLEAEADWQAGALLVPRDAALAWVRSNSSVEQGAIHFGVSISLFQWRVNQTGVMRQLAASVAWPRGRTA